MINEVKKGYVLKLEYGLNEVKFFKTFKAMNEFIFKKLSGECYSCALINKEVLKWETK